MIRFLIPGLSRLFTTLALTLTLTLTSSAAEPPVLPTITIHMNDSWGDGWNGAEWIVMDMLGNVMGSGTLASGFTGTANLTLANGCYSITVTEGGYPTEITWSVSGPITPSTLSGIAPDYKLFSIGGASCTPDPGPGMAILELFDSYGDGWNGATFNIHNAQGQLVFTTTLNWGTYGMVQFALGENCFDVTVSQGGYPQEISWRLYYDDDPAFDLTGIAPYSGEFCYFTGIPGCTDPIACNFSADATVDDFSCCYERCVHVQIGGGSSFSGNTFTLYNSNLGSVLSGNLPFDDIVCLSDGCFYDIYMNDLQGDMWNGSSYSFSDAITGEVWCTGTMDRGSADSDPVSIGYVLGCTDIHAANYNPLAVCDNHQCCDSNQITIKEYDYAGDGWEGNHYYLYTIDDEFVAMGTLENGDLGVDTECLPNGCYKITIAAVGGSAQELYFDIYLGNTLLVDANPNGGAWLFYEFCIDEPIVGCTESSSCNYEANASIGNTSCCELNCVAMSVANNEALAETYWKITNENGEMITSSDEPSYYSSCLEDGCYTFSFLPGNYIGYTNYELIHLNTGEVLLSGTTGPGNYGPWEFCVFERTGCTDSNACNFDADATSDDGSCCYDSCMQLVLVDIYNNGWQNSSIIFEGPGGNLFSGYLADGDSLVVDLCIANGCYGISGYGIYDEGTYWQLKSAEDVISSGSPGQGNYTLIEIGTPVEGCTDSHALNFDPLASCDNCTCVYACKPDFSLDDQINIGDFLIFLAHFDCELFCCRYDLTDDGTVSISDLLIFTASLGETCN